MSTGEAQLWTFVRRLEPLVAQEADGNKLPFLPQVEGENVSLGFGAQGAKARISSMADAQITALKST